jgi:serine/threonine-protein kinase HipA
MKRKCLYCYKPIEGNEDFHSLCSKKIFGQANPPIIDFDEKKLEEMALQVIKSQISVTGVQPKLSLGIASGENKNAPKRLTIVGLWGDYILKPPSKQYFELPEIEDLTMKMANAAKINTVPHSLIRLSSGSLAYITKRIDRLKNEKLHMEDMCQLTEKMTEDKYHGSHELIAKTIRKYSANPGLDLVNFCEQVLFSFVIGNADMHMKNFSLINMPNMGYVLSPAYDMLATKLVNPKDLEELALTLNGKKNRLKASDFRLLFNTIKLEEKQQENIFNKMLNAKPKWLELIELSFLSDEMKQKYIELLNERLRRLTQ